MSTPDQSPPLTPPAYSFGSAASCDDSQPDLTLESLGGGTQSSCIAQMHVEGVLTGLDAVFFADTGGEMPETYEHVEYLADRLATVGVPLIVVTGGDLEADIHAALEADSNRMPSIPVRIEDPKTGELQRINNYHCSYDYKRRVVEAGVKKLLGPRGQWRTRTAEQWIGYTIDEGGRVKQPQGCRCGHPIGAHYANGACVTRVNPDNPEQCARECAAFDPWLVSRFPLIEMGMRRGDCTRWLRERGLPVPPRSACWFCPNRGNGHWRDLRDNHPHLFERAISLDEAQRLPRFGVRGRRFIHQSGVPLAEADLRTSVQRRADDDGQHPLFEDNETALAYDCDLGTCFT